MQYACLTSRGLSGKYVGRIVLLNAASTVSATDTGAQALALQPAQGGFVELTFPEKGHYPFVSHIMVDAERGAHGFVRVTG